MPSFSARSLRAFHTRACLLIRRLSTVPKLSQLERPAPPTESAKIPSMCCIDVYQTKVMITEPHARRRAVGDGGKPRLEMRPVGSMSE